MTIPFNDQDDKLTHHLDVSLYNLEHHASFQQQQVYK
jgi:hypothetical protein